jgi:hypothetical protein
MPYNDQLCSNFPTSSLMTGVQIGDMSKLFDLTTSVCPEIETSSFDWADHSRYPPLLPDDGDRFQSPKRRVFLIIIRRWIMSMKFVILTNHRNKPSEFIPYFCLFLPFCVLLSLCF